jgi:hypothetical protein
MNMTHYMELLATNQPWNLLYYMVVPVVLAEALVAIEFVIVFHRLTSGPLRTTSKILGILAGAYFTFAVFFRLLFTVIPTIHWRTGVDFIAVWSYLLGVVPLAGIALMELGIIGKRKNDLEKMKLHFVLITIFLIVAHVAMIFGMVNPQIIARVAAGGMK